jgi:serine/threonine protein kinase
MDELPFQLLIKRNSPNTQPESLLCTALLRAIPGRRQVYDALWNGKSVIVKVFSHKISAKRHLKKEWQGLNLLQSRGLNAPQPLFYGQTENGQQAIVMEKIVDSTTALDAIRKTPDETAKLNLLAQVCEELARQHNKGVLQKDLHLGNFLVSPVRNSTGKIPDAAVEKGKISNGVSGDKVFALDPGQMRFFANKVGRNRAISQLAMLGCSLPTDQTKTFTKLCEEYFQARHWHLEKSDETLFQKKLAQHQKTALRRELRKCLRTSKKYLKIKTAQYTAVFNKEFCEGANPRHLVEQIDELIANGQVIKNSNTSYVARISWNGKDVAVKRHNCKGFFHSLRHTIKGSRALRGWLNNHRLRKLNIPVPKPLAYISTYKRLLIEKTYILTEYIQGKTFHRLIKRERIPHEELAKITNQILNIIERLGEYRISHGDLKDSNILITNEGPVITDLDSMKTHIFDLTAKWQIAKDIAHLKTCLSRLENRLLEKQECHI